MVELTIFLFFVAIVAFAVELWMPGSEIFGITGAIAMVISAVLAVLFVPFGALLVLGQAVILGLFLRYFIRQIRQRQLQGKIILYDTLKEDKPYNLADFIGKTGVTATSLRPYGEAEFHGVRIEVSSGGPLIEQGTKVRGTAVRESKLIVEVSKQ
ncbi:MAG: hypothetical protein FWE92_03635 [Defluviitaleaceae bacterium]|nr:hypothetical protein [Defluviitaleaceae bacterium]